MKTLLAIFIAGWALGGLATAQPEVRDRYTDSVLVRLNGSLVDSVKARMFFELSDYWSERDSAKAVDFANRSFAYTSQNSYLRGRAYFYRAGAYFNYDKLKSQQDYLTADSLLQHFSSREALQYRSRAWHNYGALEQRMDHNEAFVDLLLSKAIPLAQAAGDERRVAWNYMDLGGVFMNYKNYPRARTYYEQAIRILSPVEVSPLLAECYINKAKSAILQHLPDTAEVALSKAYQILSSTPDSSYWPVYHLISGMYHSSLAQWGPARSELDRGITLAQRLERPYDEATLLYEKYKIYKQQGQLKQAKPLLERAYQLQRDVANSINVRLLSLELAKTEAAMGHHDVAFKQLLEYTQLSDSFFAQKTAISIADQEARYRIAEKEKELLRLQNKNQLQRLFLYFGICLLTLLGFFIAYTYRQRQKRARQRTAAIQQQLEIQVANAELQGEERERRRIARDLHDGLGGILAGIKLHLSAANHDQQQGQPIVLDKIISQVDNSVHELRRIARNLIPEILVRSNLSHAIRDLCTAVTTPTMGVTCELLNLNEALPQSQKIAIYRIVQELLTNAVKHAQATEVFLQCSSVNEHVYITIEDNGRGMPTPTNLENMSGMGLGNIRSRVEYMRGKMDVQSVPGKGVIINIEIHVAEEKWNHRCIS